MPHWIEELVVAYGFIAIILTAHLGFVFWKHRHISPLIKGVALMSWGFTLICTATFTFGFTAWLGTYWLMPPWVMAILRVLIFSGATGSYFYMMRVLHDMEK